MYKCLKTTTVKIGLLRILIDSSEIVPVEHNFLDSVLVILQSSRRENIICSSYNMNALKDKYHFVLVFPAHRYIITTLLFMAKSTQASILYLLL
jgi:hypothetical protein